MSGTADGGRRGPYLHVEIEPPTPDSPARVVPLDTGVCTVGRGEGVDIRIAHPSVSRLHAELVRRGPYLYVSDLGLSRNGTRVNGRPVGRRLVVNGDVISFGSARARVGGLEDIGLGGPSSAAPGADAGADAEAALVQDTLEMRRMAVPDLTRRELDVLVALCAPLRRDEAFVAPATAHDVAVQLVVTEAAVKQHLLRLYKKFAVPGGSDRRVRLANRAVAAGVVRPVQGSAEEPHPEPDPGPGGGGTGHDPATGA